MILSIATGIESRDTALQKSKSREIGRRVSISGRCGSSIGWTARRIGKCSMAKPVSNLFVPPSLRTAETAWADFLDVDSTRNSIFPGRPKNDQAPRKLLFTRGLRTEAPVGVEPTMTDLQSVALATWLRSRRSLDRQTRYCELSLPNRENQICHDSRFFFPTAQVGRIVVVVFGAVNRVPVPQGLHL
jgi:hypothetical protein